jgi:hypothetical protein
VANSLVSSIHLKGLALRLNHFLEFLKFVSNSICLHMFEINDCRVRFYCENLSYEINALYIYFIVELFIRFVVFLDDILNGLGKLTSMSSLHVP